jgi:hypothetical protein
MKVNALQPAASYAERCRLAALGGNDRAKLPLLQRICCQIGFDRMEDNKNL